MTKEELYLELEKLGITLTDKQKEQLEIYKDFLIEYNKHTNLTRIIDEIEQLFISMGFDVVEGPEVEQDLYNFENVDLE